MSRVLFTFFVRWFVSFLEVIQFLPGIVGWYWQTSHLWMKLKKSYMEEFPCISDWSNWGVRYCILTILMLFFNRFGGTFNLNSFMLFLTAWKTLKLHTVSVKRFKCQIKRCKIRSGGVTLVSCPLDNHCYSPLIETSKRLFEMQRQRRP